jgi:hypothetical protein
MEANWIQLEEYRPMKLSTTHQAAEKLPGLSKLKRREEKTRRFEAITTNESSRR